MNIVVGVISPAPIWILPRHFVGRLRTDFPRHTFLEAWDRDTLRELLPDADVAFTPFVDRDIFPSATRLRWVQSPAVGVGSLMYPELLTSPVVISSARGIRARAIAEHVIAVSLSMARQLPEAMRYQMSHHWAQNELEGPGSRIRSISDLRMGIVGLGSIGLELAKLAIPMGFHVSAIRRRAGSPGSVESPPGSDVTAALDNIWPPDRLPDLLAVSDIVVLSLPHTPNTSRLIGAAELNQIKRGAWLINIARGKLIDDGAVVEALRDGRLGGAALDVFTHEPLDGASPYWDLPNVIITPHTSGAMRDYWTPLVALFSENLRRFERGAPLLNVVDKTAGY
ncbi:MAG TPA: D-2-hydroxyacid dehydrogenase [Vicinamibacterales bacterium]|jgi:phosphoglycerate dehydrogenase-like enzyme|nr:D-2-hydroxyacid dehydrogenase [Vicinamibacterales bacterium]